MKRIILWLKPKLLRICIISLGLFCLKLVQAQPGWQDLTTRYDYSILNKDGKEISFKKNRDYSIMINNLLYRSPQIPQKILKPALPSDRGYQKQIRINDFSLTIPEKRENRHAKRLEIKIIYKQDTMHICQSSGVGSFVSDKKNKKHYYNEYKNTLSEADFTLDFLPGHYYFPTWANDLLSSLPKIRGDVKILNVKQSNFLIPEAVYDSLLYRSYESRTPNIEKYVVNKFLNGYITVEKRAEATKFDKSVAPYISPRWGDGTPQKMEIYIMV